MSKHRPHKDQSCADADRAADEQIAWLRSEVERLTRELAARPYVTITQPQPWYPSTTPYPIITCSSNTTATDIQTWN